MSGMFIQSQIYSQQELKNTTSFLFTHSLTHSLSPLHLLLPTPLAPPTSPTPAPAPTDERVHLHKWNVVATWNYLNASNHCTICHNALTDKCLQCSSAMLAEASSECTPAWGVCSHTYHHHCISKWLKKADSCPICSAVWEYKTVD